MFGNALEFLMTVPVENNALRAVIMLAEMFAAGVVLYYLWELVPRLPRAGKAAVHLMAVIISAVTFPINARAGMKTKGPGATAGNVARSKQGIDEEPDLEQFRDLSTDLVP